MVDGCKSNLVYAVLRVAQGSVLGPLLLIICTSECFPMLENKLTGCVEDSTLMAVVPFRRR